MNSFIIPLLLVLAVVGCVCAWLWGRHLGKTVSTVPQTIVRVPLSLADMAMHLAGQTDQQTLLTRATRWLTTAEAGIPLVIIYSFDSPTNELIKPVVAGREIPTLPQQVRLGSGIYGEVARMREPRYIERVASEPRLGPTAPDMQVAYLVPLFYETSLLGVLCVQSDRMSALHGPERGLVDHAAAMISALMATTTRLADSDQAIRRFDRFQSLAQGLTARLDSKQLLQEIVEAAREMLDTPMSVLLNLTPAGDEFRPIAWAGISAEAADVLRSRYREDLKGMVGWARKPARTPDLRTDTRTALASQSMVAGMLSELAVPVLHFDKLYGVLAVETNVHRHFTDEETNLLSALAAHAGIALNNAQLFERLQQSKSQLETTVADLVMSRQQAENARLTAVEANRLKTEFVNNMSHELRTPLNAIINFTRIVNDGHAGPVTPDQTQYLTHVHDAGQHLLGLINDILDLAKVEAGKMELRREPTNLETILRGVMSTAIGLTRDHGLYLKQEIDPDLPLLNMDGVRIRQVLLNLLSNAAKFTQEGGITLRAYCRDKQVIVAVQDTGIGIRPEDIPKVFEEFRQINGALQRAEAGTGLGMPVSQRFVQLHGGEMWIESTVGVGSTVYFSLPLEEPVKALRE